MLKTITTMSLGIVLVYMTAAASYADRSKAAKNVYVQDVYKEVKTSEPYTTRECVMVRSGGDAASGALMGMIVGGLIGKGATGKDDGAAAGAVIGGIIGADKGSRNAGQLTEKCTNVTRYQNVMQTVYDYSVISFRYEGREYVLSFIKK